MRNDNETGNHGPAAIKALAQRVATTGGKDFVPVAERIAVFDNDGCLSVAREIVPAVRASAVA